MMLNAWTVDRRPFLKNIGPLSLKHFVSCVKRMKPSGATLISLLSFHLSLHWFHISQDLYQETISQEMGRQAVGSSLESLIMKEWKEDQCCEEDQKIMKRKEEQERYLLITALDSWTFHYIDWQLVSSSSFPKCEEKISSAKINVSGMIWKLERKKRTESLPCLLIHGLMIGSSGRIFLSLGQGTDPSSSPWVIMLRTDRH